MMFQSVMILLVIIAAVSAMRRLDKDPALRDHPSEAHHTLTAPLDKSQVYWNFGGSTVMTKNYIRLTPSTQDRRGWLWNEYPLESENWEVEFKLEVFSKPHFGGDGFAFWILGGDQDPAFSREPDFLNGPVFGMKNDFQGFGVSFDVYDNDNKRNNPSVFILDNPEGKTTHFNHDNDYEDDMLKTIPDVIPGHTDTSDRKPYQAFKCVADFRNTGRVSTVLIKFLHQVLHVYIDTSGAETEGSNFKFCLAVHMNRTFIDHHIAFTAATGQVADNHDIIEITTRYLADSDKDFDDTTLDHFDNDEAVIDSVYSLMNVVTLLASFGFLAFAGWQFTTYKTLTSQHIDENEISKQLNVYLLPHWGAHYTLCLFLLIQGLYGTFLFNLPIALIRGYMFSIKKHKFSTSIAYGIKGHSSSPLAPWFVPSTRLPFNVGMYTIFLVYCVYTFLF